jgi:cellulose synthase/poly-beta-1,6-N-acetylglucosamine synthase-like glycosyltransferase
MSNLNIFIPTYKRPKTLYWSIESVLMQDFKNQNFKKNIIIINNDESTIDEIKKVVNLVIKNNPNHQFNNIELIQGNKNLVDKNLLLIYELIFSKSEINDISIVHCDDDIMLPNTLLNRYLNSKDTHTSF